MQEGIPIPDRSRFENRRDSEIAPTVCHGFIGSLSLLVRASKKYNGINLSIYLYSLKIIQLG